MTDTTQTRDPADIERDIRQTQDDISRTVDRIGNQLTPRNMLNALLDQAESNNIDARTLLDGARRNPLALAMIAGGAIWLVSDSDAKLPANLGRGKSQQPHDDTDMHHRDYVAHMERLELREGEDPIAYQRRRDTARANFLMCERRHDEDEASFRQRLDDMTEKFREKRHAWADRGGRAAGAAGDTARSAATKAQEMFTGNPLIGGLAAAALGAIFGTVVPMSAAEEEKLAGVGGKARGLASEQKDKLADAAKDKKDELVHKAEEFAGAHGSSGQQAGSGRAGVAAYEPPLQQAASQGDTGQQSGSGGQTAQQNQQGGGGAQLGGVGGVEP
jgi:hypothetical protein